jgi:hypothetical protein
MRVKALTNIRGVGNKEMRKGAVFEIEDGPLLKDCLASGSVEICEGQAANAAAACGPSEAAAEAVSVFLLRLGVKKDRLEECAADMIAAVSLPAEEALRYANSRAELWGEPKAKTGDKPAKGEGKAKTGDKPVAASPIPVTPAGGGAPAAPDENIEEIKARALAEAEEAGK